MLPMPNEDMKEKPEWYKAIKREIKEVKDWRDNPKRVLTPKPEQELEEGWELYEPYDTTNLGS